jgi:general secretion pathway protein H
VSFRVRRQRGFTLVELLVVLMLIAVTTVAVQLSLPNQSNRLLEKDAKRLASLLEVARAKSRATNTVVTWEAQEDGFKFSGEAVKDFPTHWLDDQVSAAPDQRLTLGPEVLIPAQSIRLRFQGADGAAVITDGIGPFSVAVSLP